MDLNETHILPALAENIERNKHTHTHTHTRLNQTSIVEVVGGKKIQDCGQNSVKITE